MRNPKCERDCFGQRDGKCIILTDNKFKGDCPFYKRKSEVKWSQIRKDIASYAMSHGGNNGDT